jgi:hypothetical protein
MQEEYIRIIKRDGQKALKRLLSIMMQETNNYTTIEEIDNFIKNLQQLKQEIIKNNDYTKTMI